MEIGDYQTFSSLDKAAGVERRLLQHYLPRFEDLRRLGEGTIRPLLRQTNVTPYWPGAVLALSWEIFPSMEVVLVLMDDEEFGPELKWYFSPAAMQHVDHKFLIVFVEKSMDLVLACLDDPDLQDVLEGGRRCLTDGTSQPPLLIRSKLFCYSIPTDGIVPPELRGRGQELGEAVDGPVGELGTRDRDLEAQARASGLDPVMCLDVIHGVRGCLGLDGGRLVLALDSPDALRSEAAEEILSIARVQAQVISDMLGPPGS